jgi:hypothetical protein
MENVGAHVCEKKGERGRREGTYGMVCMYPLPTSHPSGMLQRISRMLFSTVSNTVRRQEPLVALLIQSPKRYPMAKPEFASLALK